MREAFRGQDVVIHCAGLSRSGAPPDDYRTTNVIGSRNVMQAMAGTSVKRWIHLSTAELYSNGGDRMGVRESDPLGPKGKDPLIESKRQTEIDIDNFVLVPAIIFRPHLVFGPGDRRLSPFLARFSRWGRVPQFDLGESMIDPIFVDNVVDAIAAAVVAPDSALGKIFNISNAAPVENLSFLTTLAETKGKLVKPIHFSRERALKIARALEGVYKFFSSGSEPPLPANYVRLFTESLTLNTDAVEYALGYKPKISMREAMKIMAAHRDRSQ
jgi:nucleoside-diphosphate-sugar epimerase